MYRFMICELLLVTPLAAMSTRSPEPPSVQVRSVGM